MRSSTLFALLGAILLGLGVAVAAKATGLLNKTEPRKEAPPQMVLTAAGNIFEGACLQTADVKLRPIHPEELDAFKRNELLPPMTAAAVRRFAKVSIEADRPIRRDQLEDLNAPPTLKERLAPGMEAMNMAIPKPQCAGGMINVGDWVNVMLTTAITDASGASTTATALIARNVRVAAKRNSLWPVPTPLGPDCPVNFTLELNPYRAALLNFVKDKGTLILSPLADADKRALEARRNETLAQPGVRQASFSQPDSLEHKDDDARVAAYLQGNYAVGEGDLMRIFKVKVEEPPAPPPPPARVRQFIGVRQLPELTSQDGAAPLYRTTTPQTGGDGRPHIVPAMHKSGATASGSPSAGAFSFQPPALAKSGCPGCRSCGGAVGSAGGCQKCGQK